MVPKLEELGLINYQRYRGLRLTKRGRRVALSVLRRHRLVELMLAEALAMPLHQVDAEAEELEHVVSDALVDQIARQFKDPKVDPHGDPIPAPGATELDEGETQSVYDLPTGTTGRFVRISDSEPEMVRYLEDHDVAIGADIRVGDREPFGGPVRVQIGDRSFAFGNELAAVMRIAVDEIPVRNTG
jgi:DtxR family Mn-dependent transcriptional regulator